MAKAGASWSTTRALLSGFESEILIVVSKWTQVSSSY